MKECDQSHRKGKCGYWKHLWATYDHPVLFLLATNSLNTGSLSMLLMIVVNMYQDNFELSPG